MGRSAWHTDSQCGSARTHRHPRRDHSALSDHSNSAAASPSEPPISGACRAVAARLVALPASVPQRQLRGARCPGSRDWSPLGAVRRHGVPLVSSCLSVSVGALLHWPAVGTPATIARCIDLPFRSDTSSLPSRASADQPRWAPGRPIGQTSDDDADGGSRQILQRPDSPTQRVQERAEQTGGNCRQRAAGRGESRQAERWAMRRRERSAGSDGQ